MTLQSQLLDLLDPSQCFPLVVACADDEAVIESIYQALAVACIKPVLVGDQKKIQTICSALGYDVDQLRLIHETDPVEACRLSVELALETQAILMKGMVDTKIILRAVLKTQQREPAAFLSHLSVAYVKTYQEPLYIVSDAGLNIAPTLDQKMLIIDNAISLAKALRFKPIYVALLSAVEKVNEKMGSTVDASELMIRAQQGRFKEAIVEGPYGLDNAINMEAAKHKGVSYQGAGRANVLIAPNIEAGNMLIKSMTYFAKAETAGIVMGAQIPIVLNSRADSASDKLNSILLGCVVGQHG
jgi:phosphate butyryltransferase